jgi:ribosomal protein S18 acetylase RimI-like enzyme
MPDHLEDHRPPYRLSTDPTLLDLDTIHGYLARSYWSPGIARSRVVKAIECSICFGVYDPRSPRPAQWSGSVGLPAQVAFARVVTDRASFAYLCDVFVLEDHRGQGLSKWLMATILIHPDLRGLRRFCLLTRDAHALYAQHGFKPMPNPDAYMECTDRESYKQELDPR